MAGIATGRLTGRETLRTRFSPLFGLVLFVTACGNTSGTAGSTVVSAPAVTTIDSPASVAGTDDLLSLAEVRSWLYLLDVNLEQDVVGRIASSDHDLIVLDFIPSEANNIDYPMAEVIELLHTAAHPKLVLAYIDIGQAEDYRTYWEPSWRPGDPVWIAGVDPDGWEGNYPVAYWYDEWRSIWLDEGGLIEQIVEVGFDGVYLDWVEAYSDENVLEIANGDGVDARQEMIWWVADIAEQGRSLASEFLVIGQNAAELVALDDYATIIDGIAQEQIWFDGAADNEPPGDCPLPRTDADVDSEGYANSLSDGCRRQYDEFPESTLHVSSEEYLRQLEVARSRGLPILTVDYALDSENIAWIYETSRSLGFVPFVGSRALDGFIDLFPQGSA
jgi:cysteinyl-tRNA synthetase